MPSVTTIKLTLAMVSALESSGGLNTSHPVITNPNSIHYGESAQGEYGMMPKTLAEFGSPERLTKHILKRNGGCPIKAAVIQWEQGQNVKVSAHHWNKGNAPVRLKKVMERFPKFNRTKHYGKRFN